MKCFFIGALILFDLLCHQSDDASSIPILPSAVAPAPAKPLASNTDGPIPVSMPTNKQLTLEETLNQLKLTKFTSNFESEQMDMDTLVRAVLQVAWRENTCKQPDVLNCFN